jgi:hypothetical protein
MPNRLLVLAVALLAIAPRASIAQMPKFHMRQGTLPPMVVTQRDLEQLASEIVGTAVMLDGADTVTTGRPTVMVSARTVDRRVIGSTLTVDQLADTLHGYLTRNEEYTNVGFSVNDSRGYRPRETGLGDRPHIGSASLNFSWGAEGKPMYIVNGHDAARVQAITDRIERFGREHQTWRGPEIGEMARNAVKIVALLLLPLALALRDRRRVWLLYPASAALFAGSYLFPFAVVFSNLTITG